MKVGLFRDDTQWLDENHSLEFYKLQNGVRLTLVTRRLRLSQDTLLFKVKNVHLSRAQKVRVLIPSQNGVEIEVKYDYLTTVRDTIRRLLHIEDTDTEEDDTRWSLLLPTCKVDGKLLSTYKGNRPVSNLLRLVARPHSHPRFLQSIWKRGHGDNRGLWAFSDSPNRAHSKAVRYAHIFTVNPQSDLSIVKSKWDEEENVEWWMKLLLINKWNKFDPKENPSKWKKLKAMARKGIPGFLRGDIWPIITGATTIYVPGLYKVSAL